MSVNVEKNFKQNILEFSEVEIAEILAKAGEPSYRAGQIFGWLYAKGIDDFGQMTNVGKTTCEFLSEKFKIGSSEFVSRTSDSPENTQKFLLRLGDGNLIECVLIPSNKSSNKEGKNYHTLCVSSQVGCAYACKFCASGLNGLQRNLTCGEIVEQVLWTQRISGLRVRNVVYMGMGEPLANFNNVVRSAEILHEPKYFNIGARHITISTSGVVPQIKKLSELRGNFRLALSLHAPSDSLRDEIMPINKRYPLAKVLQALEDFLQLNKSRITFEYVLLKGFNDGVEHADLLAKLLKRFQAKAHVNLIQYNPVSAFGWQTSSPERQRIFLNKLRQAGINTTLRISKGSDQNAACGQLARITDMKKANNVV